MKKQSHFLIFLFLGLIAESCGRPYNSSSSDASKYGAAVAGSEAFIAARTIMSSKCFSCHAWSAYTEADYVSTGRLTARSPIDSSLYYKIQGNDTGISGNMPLNSGDTLSAEEIATIKTWIMGM